MELGKDMEDSVIEDKIKAQKPEQCALLIYTVSGRGGIICTSFDSRPTTTVSDDKAYFFYLSLHHTPIVRHYWQS